MQVDVFRSCELFVISFEGEKGFFGEESGGNTIVGGGVTGFFQDFTARPEPFSYERFRDGEGNMVVNMFYAVFEGVLAEFHVRVDEEEKVSFGFFGATVALRASFWTVREYMLSKIECDGCGAVCAVVVNNDEFEGRVFLVGDGSDASLDNGLIVLCCYDDRDEVVHSARVTKAS